MAPDSFPAPRRGAAVLRPIPLLLALGLLACGADDGALPTPSATASSPQGTGAPPTTEQESTPTSDRQSTATSGPRPSTPVTTGQPSGEPSGEPACTRRPVRLGDSDATLALAEDPAACGAPEYRWLDPAGLAEITATGRSGAFPAALLAAALRAEDITPPEPPRLDTQWRVVTYTTQDRGVPVEATTLLAWSRDVDPGAPVLLLLHGTSGFTDGCGTALELGWQALAAYFASLGYVVVAPDYIGLRMDDEETGFPHPYLAGEPTAIASLDAVRAGLAHLDAVAPALCPSQDVVILGASQGGHAALWVDRLAAHYAPELELLGTVATVPPADLLAQLRPALLERISATGNTLAFLATTPFWYGLGDRLAEALVAPFDEDIPAALQEGCSTSRLVRSLPDDIEEIFQAPLLEAARAGLDELARLEPWGCLASVNSLTRTTIPRIVEDADHYGILWVLGEQDELVDSGLSRRSAEQLCADGTPVALIECEGSNHTRATYHALPEIQSFLRDRADRQPFQAAAGCSFPPAARCANSP